MTDVEAPAAQQEDNENIINNETAPSPVPNTAPLHKPDGDDDDEEDLFADAEDEDKKENDEKPAVDTAASSATANVKTPEDKVARSSPAAASAAAGDEESSSVDKNTPKASSDNGESIQRIPLKSPGSPSKDVNHRLSSAPTSSRSLISSLPGMDPSVFGLPADVKIPKSVNSSLLKQGKLLDTIKSLPVNLINDALQEYDDAVEVKGEAIRNHGAYLYGVVKRYVSVNERAHSGEGSGILPMGERLTPTVHTRLEKLVTTGFCTREEMNEKVRSKIRMLSEKDALFALDELSSVERSSIRNFGSYFMGILNRYMRGDHSSKIRPTPSSSSSQTTVDRGRGRDRFYRDNHQQQQQQQQSSFQRDRSRDRYDDRGRYSDTNNSRFQATSTAYGNRSLPPPPPPPQQQPSHSSSVYDSRQQHPIPWQQQPQQPSLSPYGPPGGGMSTLPPGGGANQQPYMQQAQQQTPGMFSQQHAVQGYPMMTPQQAPMQQQAPSAMMGNQIQPQLPPSYMGNQQLQAPTSFQPQQQPQSMIMNQQYGSGGYAQAPQQQQGGWQQQPQQQNAIPLDILGLADKAASAVQALANQNKLQQQQPQQSSYGSAPPVQQQQQPQSYGVGQIPYHQQQQQPLMGQQDPQQLPQLQPYGSNPMGIAPPSQGGGGPPRSGRRTTASMIQLPVTVQFAVQNLQATGLVEAQLDDGILGMIFDLPEQMALSVIQKFATIDKSSMRNKTAYFAGMLRRELEGIRKR